MSPLLQEHLQLPPQEQDRREASITVERVCSANGRTVSLVFTWHGPWDGLLPITHEVERLGVPEHTPWPLEKLGEHPNPDARLSYYRRVAD